MSLGINFGRGQFIEAVTEQVKQNLSGRTLRRSKVTEAVQEICGIIDSKDPEFKSFPSSVWGRVRVVPWDSIDRLPPEVLKNILKHVPMVGKALVVSPQFNAVAKVAMLEKAQGALSNAFGAAAWKEFMGADVGEEPPLPADILEILAAPCRFAADGRLVADTHLLTLIPETINGQPLNINTLGKLFKAIFPNVGDDTGYSNILNEIQAAAVNHGKSCWVLMTRNYIKGSGNKTFAEQQALVAKRGQNKYEVPLALEAVACILLEFARTKGVTRLFNSECLTNTRCQERTESGSLVVGDFSPAGLAVSHDSYGEDDIPIAALRNL
jgi:hypothetical protein